MFSIILKETKEFLRDKTNLFFYIMFPVILIFLLGNLLQNMDKAEDTIGTINIQYQLDTDDQNQRIDVLNFINKADQENGMIVFEETKELETAKLLAGKNEITAAIQLSGNPMEIKIFEGTNQIKNKAVGAIISGFVQANKAYSTVVNGNAQALSNIVNTQDEFVEQKKLGVNRTMIDYYAVSMLAMVSFMSILVGTGAFLGERQSRTINRLIIAPKNRVFIFLQKILGMIPQIVSQILIIMFISVVVFKAHYAMNLQDNLYLFLMFLLVTLCMNSIGAAIGMVLKVHPMAAIMPILWTMMFFGGTYSRGMRIKGVTEAMPIYQIQQAAYDLAIFGHKEKATWVILICFGTMLVALCVGAYLFSRKQEEQ